MSGGLVIHHRDTEDTEIAQRLEGHSTSLCPLCALCVSVVNCTSPYTQLKFALIEKALAYLVQILKLGPVEEVTLYDSDGMPFALE